MNNDFASYGKDEDDTDNPSAEGVSETPQSLTEKERLVRLEMAGLIFAQAQADMDKAKATLEKVGDEIARLMPEQAGDVSAFLPRCHISVSRSETYKWDQEGLAAHFGANGGLPDYVSERLAVDRRKYDKLMASEKAELTPFLTVGLTKARIKVRTAPTAQGESA